MRSQLNDNTLTLYLERRLGVDEAQSMQDELMEAVAAHPGADLVLDASDLEYISSSGLRVFVKLFKQVGGPVPIVNVGPEIYGLLESTGFTALTEVRRKLREISLVRCEVIGQGASSTVYRIDEDTVVKVFNPAIGLDRIERERENAKAAFINGLPTAISFGLLGAWSPSAPSKPSWPTPSNRPSSMMRDSPSFARRRVHRDARQTG